MPKFIEFSDVGDNERQISVGFDDVSVQRFASLEESFMSDKSQVQSLVRRLQNVEHSLLNADMLKKMKAYESLDYDIVDGRLYQQQLLRKDSKTLLREEIFRWVLSVLIGLTTGIVGFIIDLCTKNLTKAKFSAVYSLINSSDDIWAPLAFYICFNLCCTLIATALVMKGEVVAGGSGIPEVKTHLNGVKVPRLLRLKTLFCKAIGVFFSVAAGLAVGKEGPMIHVGSVVAAGFSQLGSKSLKFSFTKNFRPFNNDHDKRDFISVGAATGVAAAFGSPTGGALFSIEEAASFWNQSLTWRTYFACMICTFTLNFFLSGITGKHEWGKLSQPGLITFGGFESGQMGYSIWELPLFIILGTIGGLMGALFVATNKRLTLWRMKHVNTSGNLRMLEALGVSLLTSLICFFIPWFFMECNPLPSEATQESAYYQKFYCDEGQFSSTGTLFFTTMEEGIKELFHRNATFSVSALATFIPVYFTLATVTYGIGLPSGLFVPSLLSGASVGRLFGHLLADVFQFPINPGHYALIGASAMLGGMARMTISLTIILVETTNNIQYALPIMLAVFSAKLVGDRFTPGIYDLHIQLKGVPLLEWEPPKILETLKAKDIMSANPVCFRVVEQVRNIVETLKSNTHNGFPVVQCPSDGDTREGYFRGIILRSQLGLILKEKAFQNFGYSYKVSRRASKKRAQSQDPNSVQVTTEDSGVEYRFLTIDAFLEAYPNFPTIKELSFTEEELDQYIDLNPYMNAHPVTCNKNGPATRVFRNFRAIGLRHLCVLDSKTRVVGIITRKDLVEDACDRAALRKLDSAFGEHEEPHDKTH